jgi:hypothetical protein
VQPPDLFVIGELGKALEGVLVDRLEHSEPTSVPGTHERLLDERLSASRPTPETASALSASKPPSKTARRAKYVCSSRSRMVAAPVERCTKRSLSFGRVPGSRCQNGKRALESSEQSVRVEDGDPRRSELERQRQSVEPAADLRNGLGRLE